MLTNGVVLTTVGMNLISRSITEQKAIDFTHFKAGDGDVATVDEIKALTDIAGALLKDFTVGYVTQISDSTSKITGQFGNEGQTEENQIKEYGLFAKLVGDTEEVLFAYQGLGAGFVFPPYSGVLLTQIVDFTLTLTQDVAVVVKFDPTSFVDFETFNEELQKLRDEFSPNSGSGVFDDISNYEITLKYPREPKNLEQILFKIDKPNLGSSTATILGVTYPLKKSVNNAIVDLEADDLLVGETYVFVRNIDDYLVITLYADDIATNTNVGLTKGSKFITIDPDGAIKDYIREVIGKEPGSSNDPSKIFIQDGVGAVEGDVLLDQLTFGIFRCKTNVPVGVVDNDSQYFEDFSLLATSDKLKNLDKFIKKHILAQVSGMNVTIFEYKNHYDFSIVGQTMTPSQEIIVNFPSDLTIDLGGITSSLKCPSPTSYNGLSVQATEVYSTYIRLLNGAQSLSSSIIGGFTLNKKTY